jgi:tetratricopeptide (TPR) repeat protein
MVNSRTVRIFLSSTFRDFGEERDLLVKRVFPALRAKLKDRFVELVDVDLRWGITVEEAERGEVLPICLAEIDRSRPYFIGMLGERYGWIPPQEGYAPNLLERQPWLKKHRGGKSVTELEILHGVLKNKRMKSRAFFYFRSPAYARAKGGHYVPDTSEDKQRQLDLKRRIKDSGYSVTGYRDPQALAKRMERDLWKLLDTEFPATEVPDAFERESMRHEAYAAPRRRFYLGGERYQTALGDALASGASGVLIQGASGGGKSALLANFLYTYRRQHRQYLVHEHYLSASADAADSYTLVRRLVEFIQRSTSSAEVIAKDPQQLMDSLPQWLAVASGWARRRRRHFVIALDSLNTLSSQQDLRWWPAFIPGGVTLVVSCLPGPVLDMLSSLIGKSRRDRSASHWQTVQVRPMTPHQSTQLLQGYLARFNKKLPLDLVSQVRRHPLASNPLFVRTLAEELRLFGVHEALQERLNHYLASQTIDALFALVLERVDDDCGRKSVKAVVSAIWVSRAGLTEKEILALAQLTPAAWATIRLALDEALMESQGRIIFAHDYVRLAVRRRYLPTGEAVQAAHAALAKWFHPSADLNRRAEEEPYQWQMAKRWQRLRQCLTERTLFEAALASRGAEELIAYWVRLQSHQAVDVSKAYRHAWLRWTIQTRTRRDGALAMDLSSWLQDAGYFTPFTVTLNRYALDIALERNGARSLSVALTTSNLAIALLRMGRLQEARSFYAQSISLMDARGVVNPESQTCRTNYALCLLQCGQFEAAQQMLTQVAAAQSKLLGADHPDTISTLMSIAIANSMQGDQKAALEGFKTGLAATQSRLGRFHPATAGALSNLGIVLKRSGNLSAAKASYERALAIYEQSLGPDHPDTLMVMNNQATLLRDKGDLSGAEVLYRKALAGCERTFGEGHPDTADTLSNLAVLLQMKGDREAAIICFRRALTTLQKMNGFSHPDTEWTAQRLAAIESEVTNLPKH